MKPFIHTLLAIALFAIGWSWGHREDVTPPAAAPKSRKEIVSSQATTPLANTANDLRSALAGDIAIAQNYATQLNEQDPLQTLTILALSGAGPRAQKLFEAAFAALATRDLAAALRFYREHSPLRPWLDLKHALNDAAEKDGANAWQFFLQQRELLGLSALRAIAEGWARKDPSAAFVAGSAIADESERAAFLSEVIAGWARKDTKAFLAWLKTQPLELIAGHLRGQRQWLSGRLDANTLRELATTLPGETLQQSGWREALEEACANPSHRRAAPEWIRKLSDPMLRDQSWRALAMAMLKAGQANEITALLPQVTSAEARTAIASMAAVALIKQPHEAMKFVDALADSRDAEMARFSVFDTWMSSDQKAATEWAKTHYSRLPESHQRHLIDQLISTNSLAALAWVETTGDHDLTERTTRRVADVLYNRDPEEAARWMGTLPAGPARDAAVKAVTSSLVGGPTYDFPGAMRMSQQVTSLPMRMEMRLQILARWRYLDAKSAQAWLSTSQAGPLLGAEGFVKARELMAKPLPKFSAGDVHVVDELGIWAPHTVQHESWRIGGSFVEVYY